MKSDSRIMVGWDIGGVNIKAARFECRDGKIKALQTVLCPFEIWQDHTKLKMKFRDIGEELNINNSPEMAVTITAELSDAFRNKREGVLYILDAIEQTFEKSYIYPFSINGEFLNMDKARKNPLLCAATNWLASACFISAYHADYIPPDFILMDIGSTTTDIIPIRDGKVIAKGNTDTSRMISGELLYTGILRANPNSVVRRVPVAGKLCTVAAEYFTSMADVYLILGLINSNEYSCPTADGRAKNISAARERLSRLVCSDSELMCNEEIYMLACYIKEKQLQQIVESLFQVLSGLQDGFSLPMTVVGTGGFLAKEAARRLDIAVIELEKVWDHKTLAAFPALAAGYLLAQNFMGEQNDQHSDQNRWKSGPKP